MSTRKRIVESYIDGFRRSHHAQILSCLTDDVVWEIHGHAIVRAKAEFDGAIENEATPGHPTLAIDRLIDEGDSVVAVGSGSVALRRWAARVRLLRRLHLSRGRDRPHRDLPGQSQRARLTGAAPCAPRGR